MNKIWSKIVSKIKRSKLITFQETCGYVLSEELFKKLQETPAISMNELESLCKERN